MGKKTFDNIFVGVIVNAGYDERFARAFCSSLGEINGSHVEDFKKDIKFWKNILSAETRLLFWFAQFSSDERAMRYALKQDEIDVNGKPTSALYPGVILRYGILGSIYGTDALKNLIDVYRGEIRSRLIEDKIKIDLERARGKSHRGGNLCRDIIDIDPFWGQDKEVGHIVLDELSKDNNRDRRRYLVVPFLADHYKFKNDHLLRGFISVSRSSSNKKIADHLELLDLFKNNSPESVLQKTYEVDYRSKAIKSKLENSALGDLVEARLEGGLFVYLNRTLDFSVPSKKQCLSSLVIRHILSKEMSKTKPGQDINVLSKKLNKAVPLYLDKYLKASK